MGAINPALGAFHLKLDIVENDLLIRPVMFTLAVKSSTVEAEVQASTMLEPVGESEVIPVSPSSPELWIHSLPYRNKRQDTVCAG